MMSRRTLLMIGDSLMGQHDFAFGDVLVDRGADATVIDAHVNGSGLIGPVGDAESALAWVQETVAEYPSADTVVIQWAGACAVCGTTIDGVVYPAIGDVEGGFYDEWVHNAIEIIDWLHDQGKNVVWVVSPPMGLDSDTAASGSAIRVNACTILSMYDVAVLAPYASATRVDWTSALGDTNRKYASLLWYDSQFNEVRTGDKTHFTLEGATRAATWTAAALVDLFAQLPPPPDGPSASQLPVGLIEAGDPVTLDGPAV